jgi:hypothetical protein
MTALHADFDMSRGSDWPQASGSLDMKLWWLLERDPTWNWRDPAEPFHRDFDGYSRQPGQLALKPTSVIVYSHAIAQ